MNTIIINKKIATLSHSIENYSQKLITINQKISDNEKSYNLLNKTLDSKFIDIKFEELLRENKSLQELYAPNGICFGCGCKNKKGLQIKSYAKDNLIISSWLFQILL